MVVEIWRWEPIPRSSQKMHITIAERFYLRKLHKLLECAKRTDFLEAIWVLNRSSTHKNLHQPRGYHYPPQCFSDDFSDPHRVHPWELETLVLEIFRVTFRQGRRILDVRSWNAIAALVNTLRSVENYQTNHVQGHHILNVMHRLLYRQLVWQDHPKLTPALAVRWWSIISSNGLREIFERKNGVSLQSFIRCSLGWNELLKGTPFSGNLPGIPELGVTDDEAQKISDLLSISPAELEKGAIRTYAPYNELAYRTNPLRLKPIVKFQKSGQSTFIRPIEQLLTWRLSSGLYYDVVSEPTAPNLIATAFENYVRRLINAKFPKLVVRSDFNYGTAQNPIFSPDVVVLDGEQVLLVIECKSKKATASIQLELRSDEQLKTEIRELAKGRVQINRFHLAVYEGRVPGLRAATKIGKIVVTLDDWLFWGDQMLDEISHSAEELEHRTGHNTENVDPFVEFCNCAELENIVSRYTQDEILGLLLEVRPFEYRRHRLREYFVAKMNIQREYGYPLKEELNLCL